MSSTTPETWKLGLAGALAVVVGLSAFATAPRRSVPAGELRRLVLCAIALYLLGGLASVTHHGTLAGVIYASGITACAFAVWLSRGSDTEDPPGGENPSDHPQPPPEPENAPRLDWDDFERAFRAYSDRPREPVA